MFSRTVIFASLAVLAAALPAGAQPMPRSDVNTRVAQLGQRGGDGSVRVQASIGLFLPSSAGESEDAVKLSDRARSMLYEKAAKECDLLLATLAKECRLESVSVNTGRQGGPQRNDGIQASGSMTFRIVPK